MSKYDPLWNFIKKRNKDKDELSFKEIASILGFKIDHSFLTYKKELDRYGYSVEKISLKDNKIIITRVK